MKKLLCYAVAFISLLSCSTKDQGTSNEVASATIPSQQDTVVSTQKDRSLYIDTLKVNFTEEHTYTIYVKEYADEGPEGSIRSFDMFDENGQLVFQSFVDEIYIEYEDPGYEEFSFELIPCYNITHNNQDRYAQIDVGLIYSDVNMNGNITAEEVMNYQNFTILKPDKVEKNFHLYGAIVRDKEKFSFISYVPSQTCSFDIDSVINQYDSINSLSLHDLQEITIKCILDFSINDITRSLLERAFHCCKIILYPMV